MEIKVSTEKGRVSVTVIHIDGNIDAATQGAFLAKAQELIQGGSRHILLDLSHTPYISSAGLRAMNEIFNDLRSLNPDANLSEEDVKKGLASGTYKSPHLKLLNPSKDIQSILKATGFDLILETFSDFNTAVASF
jgi:anti-anti-sigma factor